MTLTYLPINAGFFECNYCGREVNGGTYISGVFYCPMCASIINRNNQINNYNYKVFRTYNDNPCFGCSNNPDNGGSGFCCCTLGIRGFK